MSQVYHDPAAEREADEIGMKFASSSDVVGDMSRAYGTDLSAVRIHTDEAAARRTAQRGVDAFSTGKDVFFGQGVFDRDDPASRGLLAHELGHSLQQQRSAGQTAPAGAEQGGLIDFFRRLFGRKKKKTVTSPWEMEKQRRLKELDAEDAKFAQWGRDAGAEQAEAEEAVRNNIAMGEVAAPGEKKLEEIDPSALLEQARQMGWLRYHGDTGTMDEFDLPTLENFFREASGSGVEKREDRQTGKKTWAVNTAKQSMESIMDAFHGHDETSAMRFLKPLMEFTVERFTQRYPLHQMDKEQRRRVYPQIMTEMQELIRIKQWGEKYAVPLLSENNHKVFDDRLKSFVQLTAWANRIIVCDGQSSMAQQLEMDLLPKENSRRVYSARDFADARAAVQGRLAGGGEVVPYDEFARAAGAMLPARGNPEGKMSQLAEQLTGLSYDPETQMVTTPVPLRELSLLARGDAPTLNRYADKLRGMSWRDEDGKERRAAQYDAGADEFADGFASDYSYFADMGNTAFLFQQFGGNFAARQNDQQNLRERTALAMNTRQMMSNRANTPHVRSELFLTQYGGKYLGEGSAPTGPQNWGSRTAVARPTWIKRQLLETQRGFRPSQVQMKNGKRYQSSQGAALADMVSNAATMDPSALQTPQMRNMAVQSFQQGFGTLLSEYDGADFTAMTSATFRGNDSGELSVYNSVMKANSGGLMADLIETMQDQERNDALVDRCLNVICDHIEDQGDALHDMVLGGIEATQRSAHFRDRPDLQSKYIMNNLVLRVVAPQLAGIDVKFAGKLMAAVNSGTSPACERLRNLLAV